ncbi:Hypothetical predicted protein [Podarcis lilfordi]|uniref:Uncharacterized protein n=1 Tax=Podarcis lilfordi TaxID=74358 RepID=A0AA35LE59_9SAUR|nr:Hypothetical predicted protein [Podarcis lilfordi]
MMLVPQLPSATASMAKGQERTGAGVISPFPFWIKLHSNTALLAPSWGQSSSGCGFPAPLHNFCGPGLSPSAHVSAVSGSTQHSRPLSGWAALLRTLQPPSS